MLAITVPTSGVSETEIQLEHSLVSLSKWEALHEKPFYGKEDKTPEETRSYVEQMIVAPSPPPEGILDRLTREQWNQITEYINSKQTATYFTEREGPKRGQPEALTSELIYYWMISFEIPFDPCENWHLNRLMTLIRIAGIKKAPPKKMSRAQIAEQQRALNAQRREQLGTTG
jgi:hypothetical protein